MAAGLALGSRQLQASKDAGGRGAAAAIDAVALAPAGRGVHVPRPWQGLDARRWADSSWCVPSFDSLGRVANAASSRAGNQGCNINNLNPAVCASRW
jgi:hypothetical protein